MCGCALCRTLLHCRDLFFCFPPQRPFPLKSKPPLPLWSGCHSNPLAPQPYLEQGGGEKSAALCWWHAPSTVSDREGGGGGGGCIQDIRTVLQILEVRETEHQHLTSQLRLVRTLNALLSCGHPDQNTGKIVACSITGDNKNLFILQGTKHLLHTPCTAEKPLTSLHSPLNKRRTHIWVHIHSRRHTINFTHFPPWLYTGCLHHTTCSQLDLIAIHHGS